MVIVLFYFCTASISPAVAVAVSLLLAIHVPIAMNMPLAFIKPRGLRVNPAGDLTGWCMIIVSWAGLFWRCRHILTDQTAH